MSAAHVRTVLTVRQARAERHPRHAGASLLHVPRRLPIRWRSS